jgi:uncharacterized protein DUF1552
MIITRMALPRRTFLRGIGAAIALPFLDSMVPALKAASTPSGGVPRLGFFYVPNGMFLPNFHPAGEGGKAFEYTPVLKPLEPLREHVDVISGLSNLGVISTNEGGGVHTRAHAGWLNGVLPKRTEGADITAGKTIDQYAADKLGADTPLRSLELTTESSFMVGNCENGYSCAYLNSTSWRTANTPLPHERDPRVVFQRLFGDGGSVAARLEQMRTDRSILDSVSASFSRLEKRLGVTDRRTVVDYLDSVRDVERRIQKAEAESDRELPAFERPAGSIPASFEEYARLMLDLQVLAYQSDLTRVSTFMIAKELSSRTYPEIGVPDQHHPLSHHQNDPAKLAKLTKLNTFHMGLFAYYLERLNATPDGDGSLLDHVMVVYGSGMSNSNLHVPHKLPIVVAGGGAGQIKGGRHLRFPDETPLTNLYLTILDKVGVPMDRVGDSTGKIDELSM